MDVYSRIIHNSKELETIQMFINMDKQNEAYLYNGMLFGHKKVKGVP